MEEYHRPPATERRRATTPDQEDVRAVLQWHPGRQRCAGSSTAGEGELHQQEDQSRHRRQGLSLSFLYYRRISRDIDHFCISYVECGGQVCLRVGLSTERSLVRTWAMSSYRDASGISEKDGSSPESRHISGAMLHCFFGVYYGKSNSEH